MHVHVQVMEQAEEDNGFSVDVQLTSQKMKRDSLKLEKEMVVQTKYEAESKPKQLLKEKRHLKLIYTQSEYEVAKLKASSEDAEKRRDAVISDRKHIFGVFH